MGFVVRRNQPKRTLAEANFLSWLGQRVRSVREQRNWSVPRLAEEANVDRVYVADIEAGRRNPGILVVGKITSALGITFEQLLEGAPAVRAGEGTPVQ